MFINSKGIVNLYNSQKNTQLASATIWGREFQLFMFTQRAKYQVNVLLSVCAGLLIYVFYSIPNSREGRRIRLANEQNKAPQGLKLSNKTYVSSH